MAFDTAPMLVSRERVDWDEIAPARYRRAEPLTAAQILAWADAHYEATGDWPTSNSGPVASAPGETWRALAVALTNGARGLPEGDSLARLLRREGRIGERRGRPPQVARHRLMCRLYAEGMSLAEIGRCFGVSRQAAWQMLKRNPEPACQPALV